MNAPDQIEAAQAEALEEVRFWLSHNQNEGGNKERLKLIYALYKMIKIVAARDDIANEDEVLQLIVRDSAKDDEARYLANTVIAARLKEGYQLSKFETDFVADSILSKLPNLPKKRGIPLHKSFDILRVLRKPNLTS